MILTETKIPESVYYRNCQGCNFVCSKATVTVYGGAQGGDGIILRDKPEGCIVESTRVHRLNVMSCEITSGNQKTPLIGAYLPPSTLDHLSDLEEVLNCFQIREPFILGDLNADIGCLRNPRDQKVADLLASFGMVDLLAHFQNHF